MKLLNFAHRIVLGIDWNSEHVKRNSFSLLCAGHEASNKHSFVQHHCTLTDPLPTTPICTVQIQFNKISSYHSSRFHLFE